MVVASFGVFALLVWGLLRGYEIRFAAGLAGNRGAARDARVGPSQDRSRDAVLRTRRTFRSARVVHGATWCRGSGRTRLLHLLQPPPHPPEPGALPQAGGYALCRRSE